jgi:hypothetical protein
MPASAMAVIPGYKFSLQLLLCGGKFNAGILSVKCFKLLTARIRTR